MTPKESFVLVLATAQSVNFSVEGNKVVVDTSHNGDKTTFHFDNDGKLEYTTCNC